MTSNPRCERLWRDVCDESPWYEKALFHALGTLEHGDDPAGALAKIEAALAERPQEIDPTIYEREADAILAGEEKRMSWSLAKESALRELVARGVPFVDCLSVLSDVEDADVQVTVDQMISARASRETDAPKEIP